MRFTDPFAMLLELDLLNMMRPFNLAMVHLGPISFLSIIIPLSADYLLFTNDTCIQCTLRDISKVSVQSNYPKIRGTIMRSLFLREQ